MKILSALLLLLLTTVGVFQVLAAPATKPNIILCMTDDQGWGDVSYNGLTKIKTPNLDALASAGLRFNRFYAQQSCSPTRASVMTGRHPNRMGVFWPGMKLRKEELTLAPAVKQAGYVTGHFGKWHLNGVAGPGKVMPDSDPLAPQNCGFDESFSVSNYFETDWTFGRNGIPEKTTGDGSDVIVGEALKFIGAAAEKKKPFLAVVWFGSPHVPHKPLPEDLKAAGGSAYYGELLGVDRSIGTLRAGLRKLGLADNTMLWFSSDNGGWLDPAAPDAHGTNLDLRGRKGDMWEGGLRVPFLVRWPGKVKPGTTGAQLTSLTDVMATVAAIIGADLPKDAAEDSFNMLPALLGQDSGPIRPYLLQQAFGGPRTLSIRRGHWKYLDHAGSGGNRYDNDAGLKPFILPDTAPDAPGQLYNLESDPGETRNLYFEQPQIVKELKTLLDQSKASGRSRPERSAGNP